VVVLAGAACWELLGGSLTEPGPAPVGAVLVGCAACSVVVGGTRPAAGGLFGGPRRWSWPGNRRLPQ